MGCSHSKVAVVALAVLLALLLEDRTAPLELLATELELGLLLEELACELLLRLELAKELALLELAGLELEATLDLLIAELARLELERLDLVLGDELAGLKLDLVLASLEATTTKALLEFDNADASELELAIEIIFELALDCAVAVTLSLLFDAAGLDALLDALLIFGVSTF